MAELWWCYILNVPKYNKRVSGGENGFCTFGALFGIGTEDWDCQEVRPLASARVPELTVSTLSILTKAFHVFFFSLFPVLSFKCKSNIPHWLCTITAADRQNVPLAGAVNYRRGVF